MLNRTENPVVAVDGQNGDAAGRRSLLLRERVYQVLLDEIVSGRLAAGSKVAERSIASRLGISTTPVKEALRRLEREGFTRSEPRRGVRIRGDAGASVLDLVIVRSYMEATAARLAAIRVKAGELQAPDESLVQLGSSVARMKAVAHAPDVDEMIELNAQFHQAVRRLAGNQHIQQFLEQLEGLETAMRRRALSDPQELQAGIPEHLAIHNALVSGQAELAERLMATHVLRSGAHTMASGYMDARSRRLLELHIQEGDRAAAAAGTASTSE